MFPDNLPVSWELSARPRETRSARLRAPPTTCSEVASPRWSTSVCALLRSVILTPMLDATGRFGPRCQHANAERKGPDMGNRIFGKRITRNEDGKLLTGRALFVDDVQLPDMAHAALLRSSAAHG